MDQEKITDRNVAQLDFAAKALDRMAAQDNRTQPGWRMAQSAEAATHNTRSLIDQIMANDQQLRANLVDARNIIDNFERDMTKLESELASLKARLDGERAQREHYEGMLRRIAELVVNGAKEKPNA